MSKAKTKNQPNKCTAHRPVLRKHIEKDGLELTTIGREQFEIPATFFQTYDNILEITVRLDFLSVLLQQYIGTRMDEDSSIYLNHHEKTRFLEQLKRCGGKNYTMGAVNNAIGKLLRAGFMRRLSPATYYIDPLYTTRYINNDDRKRRINENEKWRFKTKNNLN